MLLGSGPIVIGQACEFDYSCVQACKSLRDDGYRIVLVNSNPATIMTDPQMADVIYIEPIQWEVVERIIAKERPCAILPTMGGQTALNCALELHHHAVLKKYQVEMIGVTPAAIEKAENRKLFCQAMEHIGLETVRSGVVCTIEEALTVLEDIGLPAVIRPSFTLGGTGGGIAYNHEEFVTLCERSLDLPSVNNILIDQSILGWKEFEMEVVRDHCGNAMIVCAIENIDPMGIHTGDSITVAPAQTLTDKEYQRMRQAAVAVLTEVGITTGGSNVQFAIDPIKGDMVVVEMNPRVSRSSALASKATGFPIARVATQLAVGYTLDELRNEITGGHLPASFEPALDYVVVKMPRFNFEKFPKSCQQLTTQMKSVGEVMAIGTTFQEALQKAIASLEINKHGLTPLFAERDSYDEQGQALVREKLYQQLGQATWKRLWLIADAFRYGFSLDEVQALTHIDTWFLYQIADLVTIENGLPDELLMIDSDFMRYLKRKGFTDIRLAELLGTDEDKLRAYRHQLNIRPVYKRIDSCAGEFPTPTAYMYSTYWGTCEAEADDRHKVVVLGSGPNRIGQGIEFDYCCVHAVLALGKDIESIMINCNPETVSTDYDVSDRLYFEPLTLEHVLEVTHCEQPYGVIVHCGGQTPLKLAKPLEAAQVHIIGTTPDAINCAEDRGLFQQLVNKLQLRQPPGGIVHSAEDALRLAKVFAYPLIVRPSYVLGGRAMQVIYDEQHFTHYIQHAGHISKKNPLLLDHFLDNAIEIDVDAVCDGEQVLIGGIMEHIEKAGVHSGDSSCSLPAYRLSDEVQQLCREQITRIALELGVVGFVNAQFAWGNQTLYVLEVNPRASRTVPFVAKATGLPLATIAVRCMLGIRLKEQGYEQQIMPNYFSVKQPVFPFDRFSCVDHVLGPEMRSTGEAMGIGRSFGEAFYKSQLAVGITIPLRGCVFISVRNDDKPQVAILASSFVRLGFRVIATRGTAEVLLEAGVPCEIVKKIAEGRPHNVDKIKNGEIDIIVNTIEGHQASADAHLITRSALTYRVYCTTTLAGGYATVASLEKERQQHHSATSLQDWHSFLIH